MSSSIYYKIYDDNNLIISTDIKNKRKHQKFLDTVHAKQIANNMSTCNWLVKNKREKQIIDYIKTIKSPKKYHRAVSETSCSTASSLTSSEYYETSSSDSLENLIDHTPKKNRKYTPENYDDLFTRLKDVQRQVCEMNIELKKSNLKK